MTDEVRVSAPVLSLDRITKRYGAVTALDGVSLTVRQGELLAVVGPSGCGKSTLLRVIAGLTPLDAGTVTIADRLVAGPGCWVPPEQRHVGVVFQDHALFPHLTVADNVAFGLAGRSDRDARTEEVLDLVGLRALRSRYPHELSGGEQQRVALARALAPRPAVVLFDEPFSSLDRNLRVAIREETVALLRATGATGIFVTHDQEEALAVGDRLAVLCTGRVEQLAEPEAVFHRPATRFVATFIGEADLVAGERAGDVAWTTLGGLPVAGDGGDGPVDVMIRPHEVRVVADPDGRGVVTRREFRGATTTHLVVLDDGTAVRAEMPHTAAVPEGARVRVVVDPGHALATFPRDGAGAAEGDPRDAAHAARGKSRAQRV